jgi:hypothetical protein
MTCREASLQGERSMDPDAGAAEPVESRVRMDPGTWRRRSFLAGITGALGLTFPATVGGLEDEVRDLLASTASRYRALDAVFLRARQTIDDFGSRFNNAEVTFAIRPSEVRYQMVYPAFGTSIAWTDNRMVRLYESRGRRFFEGTVDSEGAWVVQKLIDYNRRISLTRFSSLDQAEPLSKEVKRGVVKIEGRQVPCRRVSVRAPELIARNGTEEIWVSEATGFVFRSIVRELMRAMSLVREYTWIEFVPGPPTDEQMRFEKPEGAVESEKPVLLGK